MIVAVKHYEEKATYLQGRGWSTWYNPYVWYDTKQTRPGEDPWWGCMGIQYALRKSGYYGGSSD